MYLILNLKLIETCPNIKGKGVSYLEGPSVGVVKGDVVKDRPGLLL